MLLHGSSSQHGPGSAAIGPQSAVLVLHHLALLEASVGAHAPSASPAARCGARYLVTHLVLRHGDDDDRVLLRATLGPGLASLLDRCLLSHTCLHDAEFKGLCVQSVLVE